MSFSRRRPLCDSETDRPVRKRITGIKKLKLRCKKSELTEKEKVWKWKKASHRRERFRNLTDKSRELFEELRSMRYSLAKKKEFHILWSLQDRTLHEMCVLVPFKELLEVHGMGFKKYEQYGT